MFLLTANTVRLAQRQLWSRKFRLRQHVNRPLAEKIPVVEITGYLGAGQTTLLNDLLRLPAARVGVEVDELFSIAGECVCCLPDGGGLDSAFERLSNPTAALDVILIETRVLADPGIVSNLIRFAGSEGIRHAGVIEVVETVQFFDTIDTRGLLPLRFAAATLVALNKVDHLHPATDHPRCPEPRHLGAHHVQGIGPLFRRAPFRSDSATHAERQQTLARGVRASQ